MSDQARFSRNAAVALMRVILTAGLTFYLYRFLLDVLGERLLGVWALCLATTSFGSIGTLGLGGSLVKFVAQYEAMGKREKLSSMLHTALTATGISMLLVVVILYAASDALLAFVVPAEHLDAARSIFPFVLAALWISSVAQMYQSVLEGLQKYTATNLILAGGTALYTALCVWLTPRGGVMGVAVANLLQSGAILAAVMVAVGGLPHGVSPVPGRWARATFSELMRYGARLQAVNVTTMLYDPMTKYLIGRFGGLAPAAYYDLAGRVVLMVRQALVSVNSMLVPAVARLKETEPGRLAAIHRRSFTTMSMAASLVILAPGALAGFISEVWLGAPVPDFVFALLLLSAGWFVNTLSAPSYSFFLGEGNLRWVTLSHVVIAVSSVLLGTGLGMLFGYGGVVVGFVIALSSGSILIVAAYQKQTAAEGIRLLDWSFTRMIILNILTVFICNVLYGFVSGSTVPVAGLMIGAGVFGALIMVNMGLHPERTQLLTAGGMVVKGFLGSAAVRKGGI